MKGILSHGLFAAVLVCGIALASGPVQAEVKTKTIEYQEGGTTLKGVLAWDDSVSGMRPGVHVVHEWWGLNDYAKGRAAKLAEQGYVAFALDMYGDDKVTSHGN